MNLWKLASFTRHKMKYKSILKSNLKAHIELKSMSMLLNEFTKMKMPCFQFSLSSEMECLKNWRHETETHREKSHSFYEKAFIQVKIFHDHFSG